MLLRKGLCDIWTSDIRTYEVLRGAGALASCISFINENIFIIKQIVWRDQQRVPGFSQP